MRIKQKLVSFIVGRSPPYRSRPRRGARWIKRRSSGRRWHLRPSRANRARRAAAAQREPPARAARLPAAWPKTTQRRAALRRTIAPSLAVARWLSAVPGFGRQRTAQRPCGASRESHAFGLPLRPSGAIRAVASSVTRPHAQRGYRVAVAARKPAAPLARRTSNAAAGGLPLAPSTSAARSRCRIQRHPSGHAAVLPRPAADRT